LVHTVVPASVDRSRSACRCSYSVDRFLELLAKERNLPAQIATEIPNLY
jgi:hypothetical protein